MSVFIFHWFTPSRCGLQVFEPLLTVEFTLTTARPGRVLGPRCLSSSYPGGGNLLPGTQVVVLATLGATSPLNQLFLFLLLRHHKCWTGLVRR